MLLHERAALEGNLAVPAEFAFGGHGLGHHHGGAVGGTEGHTGGERLQTEGGTLQQPLAVILFKGWKYGRSQFPLTRE
ncbi:hypothetical protein NBRC116584_20750 [Hydrogenophaga sp. 5NK40-0174]